MTDEKFDQEERDDQNREYVEGEVEAANAGYSRLPRAAEDAQTSAALHYKRERAKAERVMERYFDTDIQDADSAMDVFLDNGVDAVVAADIVRDLFQDGCPYND